MAGFPLKIKIEIQQNPYNNTRSTTQMPLLFLIYYLLHISLLHELLEKELSKFSSN